MNFHNLSMGLSDITVVMGFSRHASNPDLIPITMKSLSINESTLGGLQVASVWPWGT